jgi:hypothetical protein
MRRECFPLRKVNVERGVGKSRDGKDYDVDGSSIPVFWSESGKAVGDLGPVLAPNFVPTWVGSTAGAGVVENDHADVKVVGRMCAKGFDEGSICEGGRMCLKDGGRAQEGGEGNDCVRFISC